MYSKYIYIYIRKHKKGSTLSSKKAWRCIEVDIPPDFKDVITQSILRVVLVKSVLNDVSSFSRSWNPGQVLIQRVCFLIDLGSFRSQIVGCLCHLSPPNKFARPLGEYISPSIKPVCLRHRRIPWIQLFPKSQVVSKNPSNLNSWDFFSGDHGSGFETIQEFSNIPLEHTPDPQSTVYGSEIFSFGGLGMPGVCSRGMLGFS